MASAKVAPASSFSPNFQPTAFMPAAAATTLASETNHGSNLGGEEGRNRATGSVAPAGRKKRGS
eukprot:2004744-Alexandrium_andersonii.AAC.1